MSNNNKYYNTFNDDNSFGARLNRSAQSGIAKLDLIKDYVLGNEPDKISAKIVNDANIRDEEYKQSLMTNDRRKEYNEIQNDLKSSETNYDIVKNTGRYLYDTVTHPSEWNIAGSIGESINPLEWIPGKGGKVATKILTSAATNAVSQSAQEYAVSDQLGYDASKNAKIAGLIGLVNGANRELSLKQKQAGLHNEVGKRNINRADTFRRIAKFNQEAGR
jgi:hypothetical protein